MPANPGIPEWVRNAAKARALAALNTQPPTDLRETRRRALHPSGIPAGTVVIYSGSFTDRHGVAVFVGPSGNYPAGQEVRYTLLFVGQSRLEGVGRDSFRPIAANTDIPPLVRELADAIRHMHGTSSQEEA